MPPLSVIPPIPTEPVSPKPVASPWAAAAVVYSPAVRPVSAHAVRLSASISSARICARSSTIPPSDTPWPAPLWPPLRTASSATVSRAWAITWATSPASATRTITAGRRSIAPEKTVRASSYLGSSGAITRPFSRERSWGIERVGTLRGCQPPAARVSAGSLRPGVRSTERRQHEPLGLVARALDELAHLRRALAPLAEHVRGDDLRVGRVGPADPDPHALEVGAAELPLERLEPVVAREPAAEPQADLAERQVDLVVDHEHAIEVELVGAARRTDRAPGLVHVRLRLEHRDARTAGPGASLAQLAGELLARLRQVPARDQRVRDLEADVVRRRGVAAPGVPETDDQPVDRGGGEELQDSPEADCSASSPVSPSACASAASPSAPSPTSSVSVSISSGSGSRDGGVTVASTVSSGSSSSVTPAGGVSCESVAVAFISRPETSNWTVSGMSPGSASMLRSTTPCERTPPSTTPGAWSEPTSSSVTVVWIATFMSTRRRSTWTAWPLTGWRWTSFTSTGDGSPPSSATSRIAPPCASVLRRIRPSTANSCGSPLPP